MKIVTKAVIGLSAAGVAYLLVQKSRNEVCVEAANRAEIHGFVNTGYEAVREAFAENFAKRHELGAACCVYHMGKKVVDLWGGVRNEVTRSPGKKTRWLLFTQPPRAWPQ